MAIHTDLVIGDLASDIGWKLNGPLPSCKEAPVFDPLLSAEAELYSELGLDGLSGWLESAGNGIELLYRVIAKFSLMGDRARGS